MHPTTCLSLVNEDQETKLIDKEAEIHTMLIKLANKLHIACANYKEKCTDETDVLILMNDALASLHRTMVILEENVIKYGLTKQRQQQFNEQTSLELPVTAKAEDNNIIKIGKNTNCKVYFDNKLLSLSKRQTDCVLCLLKGMSAKETARYLKISPRTVEAHLEEIKNKTHCTSKLALLTHLRIVNKN